MASAGATFFFDKDADFVTGYSSTLRAELLFGDVADGVNGSKEASDALYNDLVKGAAYVMLMHTHL